MFWETLNITKKSSQTKIKFDICKVTSTWVDVAYPDFPTGHLFIGVDPGVNFGITIISETVLEVVYGKLPHKDKFVGKESEQLIQQMDKEYQFSRYYKPDQLHVYVESAAFKSQYGQVLLEQIRYGFVQGFTPFVKPENLQYIPPSTARKKAFGNGNLSGKDLFPNINNNGADSIGVALACIVDYLEQLA
ncbi:hypothetical protein IH575_00295 [Candidatus Dojkabacteria bacterium]|nr:hypothetical protein [Candidatus Dojkabacteria bacterium]